MLRKIYYRIINIQNAFQKCFGYFKYYLNIEFYYSVFPIYVDIIKIIFNLKNYAHFPLIHLSLVILSSLIPPLI